MAKNRSISLSMSTASYLFIIAFAILAADFANGLGGGGTTVGGRTKVDDVEKNKEVQKLGRFSVEEHNRLQKKGHRSNGSGGDLEFSKVVAAETQVVSGIKYYLKVAVIEAKSGMPKMFDAEVVVQAWAHSKKLLSFEPSPATK